MGNIINMLVGIFAPLMLLSAFMITLYLKRQKLYTPWQIRTSFWWPDLIVKYRSHTKEKKGKVGVWYYLFIVSIAITALSIVVSLILHIVDKS